MPLQGLEQRGEGLVVATACAAAGQHPPPLGAGDHGCFPQQTRLTDPGLTGQEQDRRTLAGNMAVE